MSKIGLQPVFIFNLSFSKLFVCEEKGMKSRDRFGQDGMWILIIQD